MKVQRGDIFYADLTPAVGAEQGGTRPILIIQNTNEKAEGMDTIVIMPITSNKCTAESAENMAVDIPEMAGLTNYYILVNQLRAISPRRLREHIGHASPELLSRVEEKLKGVLGL